MRLRYVSKQLLLERDRFRYEVLYKGMNYSPSYRLKSIAYQNDSEKTMKFRVKYITDRPMPLMRITITFMQKMKKLVQNWEKVAFEGIASL